MIERALRIGALLVLLLAGIGGVLFALAELGIGIEAMIVDDQIRLLLPADHRTIWPLDFTGIMLFFFKICFMLCFGLGLAAFGLFVGLRSDVMYLPALLGLSVGLGGHLMTDLLAGIFIG